MLPRFVAPAGTAIEGGDLLRWLWRAAVPRRELEALAEAFQDRYSIDHVFFVSTGRAGMTILLRTLAEAAGDRNEVVTHGYTCYSVAASAIRAGLKVRPLDVEVDTLDYAPGALDALDPGRVVAVTSSNLYGIPNNLPALERFAGERGVAFVDDAAQCLDGRVGGRWAGTFGDAGLFSFDKGKNITTMQGGVVVCREAELADRLRRAFGGMPPPPPSRVAADAVGILLYALLLRPRLYWIPNRILSLGGTPFELEYPTTGYSRRLAPLARRLLGRIEELTETRRGTASSLRRALKGEPHLTLPDSVRADTRAVYPRFPVVVSDGAGRRRAITRLRTAGIGATGSYPRALVDVPEIQAHLAPAVADTPTARTIAERILTLPTHRYVSEADIQTSVRLLRGLGASQPVVTP
jgi:perosamine synthetase